MKQILLMLLLLFSTNLASAQIYKWVDDLGDLHYTDDSTKVPEKYQSSIKRMQSDKETNIKQEDLPSKNRKGEMR